MHLLNLSVATHLRKFRDEFVCIVSRACFVLETIWKVQNFLSVHEI